MRTAATGRRSTGAAFCTATIPGAGWSLPSTCRVSQPTMCAFVGGALDRMVVTSATDKFTPEQRTREPLAGAVLRLQPGVRGIPRPCVVQ